MAYRKRTAPETEMEQIDGDDFLQKEEPEIQVVEKQVQKEKPVVKQYAPTDLIPCRSVVQGALLFKGTKTNTSYKWEAANDVVEVEYQDLRSAKASRHAFLMRGYFIIEDPELLALPEWEDVRKKYGEMYSRKDLTSIFKLDVADMIKAINSLPDGVRAQMGNIAKGLMEAGSLDSIKKITAIDTLLGTDLMLFVGGGEK